MQFFTLDPLSDERWDQLVGSHARSSVFHQSGWLRALAATYGYRPIVLTSTPPGESLTGGLVFCEVKSWATGNRLVSLPFTDHADPLLDEQGASIELAEWMRLECRRAKWRYIELRPLSWEINPSGCTAQSQSFWIHTLDLAPSTAQLFRNLHKSCIQRRIRHAEHQDLIYQRSSSDELIDEFYDLVLLTRRRFRLLPQPQSWFANLMACMRPNAEVRVVRKNQKAIAAILTLRHRGTLVYKYGCSDSAFHHLAGMPYLFWKMIEESKAEGLEVIDFGRTELENSGLIRFKDRFGAARRRLNYFRYAENELERSAIPTGFAATRALCSALPDAISSRAGRLVYPHIG
jgi:CelD/BcsL family acetyltransferase involved in cellulose biosynthesis